MLLHAFRFLTPVFMDFWELIQIWFRLYRSPLGLPGIGFPLRRGRLKHIRSFKSLIQSELGAGLTEGKNPVT